MAHLYSCSRDSLCVNLWLELEDGCLMLSLALGYDLRGIAIGKLVSFTLDNANWKTKIHFAHEKKNSKLMLFFFNVIS